MALAEKGAMLLYFSPKRFYYGNRSVFGRDSGLWDGYAATADSAC
jgi:hypothetical protein